MQVCGSMIYMSCFNKSKKNNKLTGNSLNKTKGNISGVLQALAYSLLLSHITFVPYVAAGPLGGNVVGGAGHIHTNGLSTDIHQLSSSMAIDWNSYNLNANEVVNYLQPGASSIVLNRILDNNASDIRGQINANGQVILVNPNGVFFGTSASINVGGLIASGLDISPSDFMNGNYIFNEVLGTDGSVINQVHLK